MTEYFDDTEIRDPAQRESALLDQLPDFLLSAITKSSGLNSHLQGHDLSGVRSREALAKLPVLRKPVLMEAQSRNPPYGGFADESVLNGTRIFMSPGPVWEPQPPGIDPWQIARSLFAAGLRAGDRVHNALSYHMTPGGIMLDEGARALGCQVFPAGIGNTEQQVEAAATYRPDAYIGTPDYLKTILDRALDMNADLSCIKRALVSGGALFPAMRDEYRNRGVQVLQAYATADIGVIAYETETAGLANPGMIVSENLIVEIVRPGTDEVVPVGEVGELVVTTFNAAYPLVRFGTGDLTKLLEEPSPCGRTNMRIAGWMGRADQRTKVKGMFVDPRQVARVQAAHSGIRRARLVVGREGAADTLTLLVEGEALDTTAIEQSLSDIMRLKGQVRMVSEPLPNDGIVVADERDYSE
ncbi:MAG: AMP-binding protein [Granulosicoccus sp.]|nr:AMP-binding protein [Granulosicoccus sp.]